MNSADLHNLDDPESPQWESPWNGDYDELGDPDETALEMADAELDQIDRWIDVAEQNDPNPNYPNEGV